MPQPNLTLLQLLYTLSRLQLGNLNHMQSPLPRRHQLFLSLVHLLDSLSCNLDPPFALNVLMYHLRPIQSEALPRLRTGQPNDYALSYLLVTYVIQTYALDTPLLLRLGVAQLAA